MFTWTDDGVALAPLTRHTRARGASIQWGRVCALSGIENDKDNLKPSMVMAPLLLPALSNPTANRRRNHHEFFKIFMTKVSVDIFNGVQVQARQLYSVPSKVWPVQSLCSWKFWKIQDNFDLDGQLDSIAPEAPSTTRRGRNYLEFFKIFMNIGTECPHFRWDRV